MSELAKIGSRLAYDVVDIAGFLSDVDQKSENQLRSITGLSHQAKNVLTANTHVRTSMEALLENSQSTLETVQASVELVRKGGGQSKDIAGWVKHLSAQMSEMAESLHAVLSANDDIATIAKQVNILAINAKIEAARAGDAGRGFAVVAEAINELSGKTALSAEQISANVSNLSKKVEKLNLETNKIEKTAETVLCDSQDADDAMGRIAQATEKSAAKTQHIMSEAEKVRDAVENFLPSFEQIGATVRETAEGVHFVTQKSDRLIDLSEGIVQRTVALGGRSADQPFIDRVQQDAKNISALFSDAINRGEIDEQDLFHREYTPIPNTNPQQVLAPFTTLTDRILPPILEEALKNDANVIFCVAIDDHGYLPTHNAKFSKPQGADPVWNTANCRNRVIFNDRVGLKSGQSKAPFLLQVYRRDMGGGEFVLMKDLSAPIFVNGKHWGGLRMGYRADG
ncbi:methyl-accepting chemotaxis protein [Planktotalea lamellibrachiae]|nr:methyl-accepting chemotaxis protein [Aliiroseovarius lamellibrachiae]